MKRLVAEAPAKVNLALRVLRRRTDGYHELDTVFQTIELCDTLTFENADHIELTTDDARLATDSTNLVRRAASTLLDACGERRGVRIHLAKRIPLQGGLGGGSSDAAATLLCCARLWELKLDARRMEALARDLGADVPFFLHGATARGSGRGDRIRPLPALQRWPLLLGVPPFGMATREVFERASNRLTLPADSVSFSTLFGQPADWAALGNDLEQVVFEARPALRDFHESLLRAGASVARLSGSGSTVFGVFEDVASRDEARARLSGGFGSWSLIPSRMRNTGVRIRPA